MCPSSVVKKYRDGGLARGLGPSYEDRSVSRSLATTGGLRIILSLNGTMRSETSNSKMMADMIRIDYTIPILATLTMANCVLEPHKYQEDTDRVG